MLYIILISFKFCTFKYHIAYQNRYGCQPIALRKSTKMKPPHTPPHAYYSHKRDSHRSKTQTAIKYQTGQTKGTSQGTTRVSSNWIKPRGTSGGLDCVGKSPGGGRAGVCQPHSIDGHLSDLSRRWLRRAVIACVTSVESSMSIFAGRYLVTNAIHFKSSDDTA